MVRRNTSKSVYENPARRGAIHCLRMATVVQKTWYCGNVAERLDQHTGKNCEDATVDQHAGKNYEDASDD